MLDATERVARSVGFEAASTTAIAKVAGVSVGTLYRYFPDKDALLMALVRRQWEAGARAFVERLQEEIPGTLDERAERLVEIAFDMLTERLAALGEMKVPTNDLVQLDAGLIELGARAIEAQLVRRRGKIPLLAESAPAADAGSAEHERVASLILVRSVVFLARIAVRDYPDLLASGRYRREVAQLVSGYLFRGKKPAAD